MTEAEIVALVGRASAGDREAFATLVHEHHLLVFRWALVVADDPDDADDLAQLTWIKAYRGLAGFRGASKFSTWLYRLTYNTSVESGRKRRRRAAGLLQWFGVRDEPADSPTERDESGPERVVAVIREMLGDLPPRQRAVFAMVDLDGVATSEVAERLEIAEATVRVTLFRARRAIRGRLLSEEPGLMEEYRATTS